MLSWANFERQFFETRKKADFPFLDTKKGQVFLFWQPKKNLLFFGCQKKRNFSFLAAKKYKASFLDGKNPFLGEKNCFVRPRNSLFGCTKRKILFWCPKKGNLLFTSFR